MRAHITIVMASAVFPAIAFAEPAHSHFTQDHAIYLGAYDQTADATLLAQREGYDPVNVHIDEIGVDDRYTSWMAEYRYRFSDK